MKLCQLLMATLVATGTAFAQTENLSLGAGSDGSSKGDGTSYGSVRDGNLSTFWSPNGNTGRISIKFSSATSVSSVRIVEASEAAGVVGDWELVDNQSGKVISSGQGVGGLISFSPVNAKKINFVIKSATGVPKIAEFETFAGDTLEEPEPPSPAPVEPDPVEPTPEPTPPPVPSGPPGNPSDAGCRELINNDNINWRESSLQTDQAIVECLKNSLGQPVGFGEKATGGFDPAGGSKLIVITKDNPEEQILRAISSEAHHWIVFDKKDFANETMISMHRLDCGDAEVLKTLNNASEAQCRDPQAWCAANGVSSSACFDTFYNDMLNVKKLVIRNKLIDSNTTIDGRGSRAFFMFNGFKIGSDSSGKSTHVSENVIVTNLDFRGAGHTEDHGLDPDMLRITGESHDIWVHQNTFDTTGDAAFDIKVGAFNTTISFNKLINVKRASLHGSQNRDVNSQITSTMHNNLFITTDANYASSTFNALRRVPLLRKGKIHLWNNVFYNYRKDIASVRSGGRMLFEDNLVLNNAQEAEGKSDDLDDFAGDGLFDFREGGLTVKNSQATFADSNCNPIGSSVSLDQSHGSTPDMNDAYSSASKNMIGNNRFSPGIDLLCYVKATAGKGGETPYVSTFANNSSSIIDTTPGSCQP